MSGRAVVIGAGAIGVASAFYLRRSGWDVTVVDRGAVGRGCSYGNACLIVPSHSHALPGPGVVSQAIRWMFRRNSPFYVRPRLDRDFFRWARLFRRSCTASAAARAYHALLALSHLSFALYEELLRDREVDFFFRRDGLLDVYVSEKGFSGARHEREELAAAGFRATVMSREETLAFEPALSGRVVGGLFIEGEAHGHCYRYVCSLAEKLEARGARLLTGREVSHVAVAGGRVNGVGLRNGPAREDLSADLIVLAAGSWSPALAGSLGIDLPLQPAKGYSCTIDAYPEGPRRPVYIKEKRVIITPLDQRLRFGGTLELAGYDTTLNASRYRAVVQAAREALDCSFPLAGEEPWCGLRPVTPDGLPAIGRVDGIDGLILATGHAMLGFTQSPGTGKLVAEIANGQPSSIPLEPFRPGRFTAG